MRSSSPPHMADGIIDLGDTAQRISTVPNPRRRRDKIRTERVELGRLLGCVYVPVYARHHKDLGPPGDEISILIDRVDNALGLWSERHIVGAELGHLHGVVAAEAAQNANIGAFAQQLARG